MKFNLKNFLIVALLLLAATGLIITFTKSAKLINDFEKDAKNKKFEPEANSIEVSEQDLISHRSWKIKSQKSKGNSSLSQIDSENIEVEIYDENDKLKIQIKSLKAAINRDTQISTLSDNVEILMIDNNTKLIADRFIIKKGQPFEALGNVKILLSPDGAKRINAQKAIIAKTLDDMTLYQVSESPVSANLLIKGGQMQFEHGADKKLKKIILSNGAWVKSGETLCQSSRLDVFLDGAGNPSTAVFTGSPIATQKGTRIKANKIEYTVSNGQVKASGNIRTEIL